MKAPLQKIPIGNEVIYKDRFAPQGQAKGKIIQRLDQTILVIEIIENGLKKNKLIDETEVLQIASSE